MNRRAEMFLYMASRAELVDRVIAPALAQQQTVVSDRFLLSNVVYQGHAGGLDVETLWRIGSVATNGLQPNLTFVLDMPVEQADQRLHRELDRMESQGADFRQRLRAGFLQEARQDADRIAVIDASGSIEAVQAAIRQAAERVIA